MSEIKRPPLHAPPTLSRIDGDRAVVEQAKGALMLRYGISSHEAFALLLSWSHEVDATLHTIAHTLVNAACQAGDPDHYDPDLVRWLREQLSDDLSRPPLW